MLILRVRTFFFCIQIPHRSIPSIKTEPAALNCTARRTVQHLTPIWTDGRPVI